MAVISKGITLNYVINDGDIVTLQNLQEIPDLSASSYEEIEITCLSDEAHKYTNGLMNYGDGLDFKFLFDGNQFASLNNLEKEVKWIVTLPDGEECSFNGTCSVKLDGVGVAAALTYTLTVKPTSAMEWDI